ncbi:MAG: DUF1801 domain-containing protein [Pseudomonadota bacterium]
MNQKAARKLNTLINLVRTTGERIPQLGGLTQTTKWGQTSFLPVKARVGTTVRVDHHDEQHVALYVHCQTNLVETFKTLFPELEYSGNRAILFETSKPLPKDAIKVCVEAAFLYHLNKRRRA